MVARRKRVILQIGKDGFDTAMKVNPCLPGFLLDEVGGKTGKVQQCLNMFFIPRLWRHFNDFSRCLHTRVCAGLLAFHLFPWTPEVVVRLCLDYVCTTKKRFFIYCLIAYVIQRHRPKLGYFVLIALVHCGRDFFQVSVYQHIRWGKEATKKIILLNRMTENELDDHR